jgi:mannitol 2-dehydrogenase
LTLSAATLSNVNSTVQLPTYDRNKLKVGIFHFGVGGFHRAHQALIIDNLFSMGLAEEWGICGVGVLQFDAKMRDVMKDQNCLYALVEKGSDGDQRVRVIGSIIDYLFAPDDVELVIERLVNEAKIVSLTITEGGYNTNPATGEFDLEKVRDDLENPRKPKTVFGIVIEALRRRKEKNLGGFTVMSCDNLQENGKIAKHAFSSFARAVDPSLAEWMTSHVTFPCSMVDRITPVTTDEDRVRTSEKLGIVDSWPVVCEPFIQWVLEDSFVAGRPPFEKSCVQLVDDVEPYEFMKLRLLNAGHQAIAYFGLIMGYVYVHDVTRDPKIAGFLRAYMNKEATSTLKPLAGMNVEEYKEKIVERFQNPNVRDTLARLAGECNDLQCCWCHFQHFSESQFYFHYSRRLRSHP